ncbi:hypothetical protein GCM10010308_30330 [Streptomyces vinaceusdrappus]|nr:hypothetical protein GCM10010308_30330 [Streptomyces vinaceusdrappus]
MPGKTIAERDEGVVLESICMADRLSFLPQASKVGNADGRKNPYVPLVALGAGPGR